MAKRRILILGGNGFIGQRLVDRLEKLRYPVRILDKRPPMYPDPQIQESPLIESILGDFLDQDVLDQVLTDVDTVVHLVSTTIPSTAVMAPVHDVESNLIGSVRLLETALRKGVKRIFFSSSGGTVYGIPERTPIPEFHPTNPTSSYGIVKLAIEKYLYSFNQLHGLGYCILRIANPYGPGMPLRGQGVINSFLWKAARNEAIEVWGDGSVVRDYVFIEDVVDAFLMLLQSECSQDIYNVGSGMGVSIHDLVKLVTRLSGASVRVEWKPGRPIDIPTSILDTSKIHAVGWGPKVTLEEGMQKTWSWIRKQGAGG